MCLFSDSFTLDCQLATINLSIDRHCANENSSSMETSYHHNFCLLYLYQMICLLVVRISQTVHVACKGSKNALACNLRNKSHRRLLDSIIIFNLPLNRRIRSIEGSNYHTFGSQSKWETKIVYNNFPPNQKWRKKDKLKYEKFNAMLSQCTHFWARTGKKDY